MSRFMKENKEWGHILPELTSEEIEVKEKCVCNISQMKKDVKRLNETLDIPITNNPNFKRISEKKINSKLASISNWKLCNWLDFPNFTRSEK